MQEREALLAEARAAAHEDIPVKNRHQETKDTNTPTGNTTLPTQKACELCHSVWTSQEFPRNKNDCVSAGSLKVSTPRQSSEIWKVAEAQSVEIKLSKLHRHMLKERCWRVRRVGSENVTVHF